MYVSFGGHTVVPGMKYFVIEKSALLKCQA